MSEDTCEFCDGLVEDAVRRVPFHFRKDLIYVDNVPVKACRKCGELYVEAAVVKQLEKIAVCARNPTLMKGHKPL